MSRPSTSRGSGPTAAPVTTMTNADGEEQCPICKTLRYMNRNMKFLINPECYHPLCNNCVDRLFENGPNQCPYVSCHKTLRKKAFREPMFADLDVEREVDLRKRVAAVFNNTEDDFEDLRAYNDYLDMVETLTMELVYGTDAERAAATTKLMAWEDEHRAEIEKNRRHGERLREQTRRQVLAEQRAAKERRLEAARQEEEERALKAKQREEDLDALASAPAGQASRIMLKKRGQHHKEALAESEAAALRRAAAAAAGGLSIKGLKKKAGGGAAGTGAGGGGSGGMGDEDRGPYDPFGRLDLNPSRYALKARYPNEYLESVVHAPAAAAGGCSVHEYYARALFEAFAGLSVFVSDEKETGKTGLDFREIATMEAGMAAAANTAASTAASADGAGDASSKTSSVARGSDSVRLAGGAAAASASSTPADGDGDVQMQDAVPTADPSKMDVDVF